MLINKIYFYYYFYYYCNVFIIIIAKILQIILAFITIMKTDFIVKLFGVNHSMFITSNTYFFKIFILKTIIENLSRILSFGL